MQDRAVSKKDQYLQHLDSEIAKHQKSLDEAMAARDHFVRFTPQKGASSKSSKMTNKVGRKGLRAEGRSRDLFEYFYRCTDGAELALAEIETPYSMKALQQFLHRYRENGFFEVRDGKVFITKKGKALVDASQPYAGSAKEEKD